MMYQVLNLTIVLGAIILSLCAGAYIGELRLRERIAHLYEDTERGDLARSELGLYMEWATPDAEGEIARVVSKWHTV
jgi:hypothetical protein